MLIEIYSDQKLTKNKYFLKTKGAFSNKLKTMDYFN